MDSSPAAERDATWGGEPAVGPADTSADPEPPPAGGLAAQPTALGFTRSQGGGGPESLGFELIAPLAGLPDVPGFEILEELGSGGMGEVYKARQLSLNRVVALKMIRSCGQAGRERLERFRREAEMLARLRDPHIVQILEVNHSGGCPYFTMELVEGGSLDRHLRGEPWAADRAARLIGTAARAMHQAHLLRIVHRDLKPANILLTADGDPKISDFGLGRFLDSDQGPTVSEGAVLGTASYMAPEQASGRSKQAGPPADVYALGAVLYEMLTGRPPVQAGTVLEAIRRVVEDTPVPPGRLRPGLSRDLATVCLKCLEKDPARRYPSAADLADDLDRFLRREPTAARPVGAAGRFAYWCRRRPERAALAGLAAAAVVTAVALSVGFGVTQGRAARREGRLAAGLLIDKGVTRCEQGDVGVGMLWLARGLALAARVGAADAEEAARANLGGWAERVCPLKAVLGHPEIVTSVALSRDGRRALTGAWDGSARLWDTATGEPVGAPFRLPGVVRAVAFSPDGRRVLTGSADGSARLWDAETGAPAGTLSHPQEVRTLAFGPGGRTVLTGSVDGSARLWDAGTGRLTRTFSHPGSVFTVALSPDGRRALTGGADRTARLWDTETGREVRRFQSAEQGEVWSSAFAPDGRTVLTGSLDGSARLWDAETGREVRRFRTLSGVLAVAFRPDGAGVVSGEKAGAVRFWDAATGRPAPYTVRHYGQVRGLALSGDGRVLITGGTDRTARVWRMPPGPPPNTPLGDSEVSSAAFRADGRALAVGEGGGRVRLYDPATGRPFPAQPPGHTEEVTGAAFSPDGRSVLTASEDRTARLSDVATGAPLGAPLRHQETVAAVAFRPDGRQVLTACADGSARFWDAANGRPDGPPLEHPGAVLAAAYSPDGRRAVTGGGDMKVRVWDLARGRLIAGPCQHQGLVLCVAFSPDGRLIASGSADGAAQLWDAATGAPVGEPMRHQAEVISAAFSPNGRTVLTGSRDGRTRLWFAANGRPAGPPLSRPNGSQIRAVAFRPVGGSYLAYDGATVTEGAWPTPLAGTPEGVNLWAQVLSGLSLGANGSVRVLDPAAWTDCRRRLEALREPAPP